MRYMFCFKTYKLYTLLESPTLFLSQEFDGLGLLFALSKDVTMSWRWTPCASPALRKAMCVHPAVRAGRFLSHPLCVERDGRERAILMEELLCMERGTNLREERRPQRQAGAGGTG